MLPLPARSLPHTPLGASWPASRLAGPGWGDGSARAGTVAVSGLCGGSSRVSQVPAQLLVALVLEGSSGPSLASLPCSRQSPPCSTWWKRGHRWPPHKHHWPHPNPRARCCPCLAPAMRSTPGSSPKASGESSTSGAWERRGAGEQLVSLGHPRTGETTGSKPAPAPASCVP